MQPGRELRKRMWQSGEVKGFDETLCGADLRVARVPMNRRSC